MIDQLISFETAKLAKEKGFSIPTETCWIETRSPLFKSPFHTVRNKVGYITEGCDYINEPTQSLLQKWLREVHNIHLMVRRSQLNMWKCFYEKETSNSTCTWWSNSTTTYESALEQGLIEALKLIIL